MTKWYRFGHMKRNYVRVGDEVKKGQLIGTLGNADGWYKNASHLHFDISLKDIFRDYVIGWSLSKMTAQYIDPKKDGEEEGYIYNDITEFDHFGYNYRSQIRDKNNAAIGFHPGVDLNGPGAGDADYGNKIFSPVSGVVVHEYRSWIPSSWGNIVVIKRDDECKHCEMHCPK